MFSRSFGFLMLGPTAQGNPGPVARPITDVAGRSAATRSGFDAAFVVVQLLIALAIANRRTVRIGLAASILWSFLVWWFGEGLGEVLAGHGEPADRSARGGPPLRRSWPSSCGRASAPAAGPCAGRSVGWASPVGAGRSWGAVWGLLAVVALGLRHPAPPPVRGMAAGEPGWVLALDRPAGIRATGAPWRRPGGGGAGRGSPSPPSACRRRPARAAVAGGRRRGPGRLGPRRELRQLFTGIGHRSQQRAGSSSCSPLAYWPLRRAAVGVLEPEPGLVRAAST